MWLDFLLCLEQKQQNILHTGLPSPWCLDDKCSSEGFWVLMQSLMTKGWCSDVLQGPELSLSLTVVFTGITRSIDPRDTLSLLHSAEDQDCLRGPHQRSPVLFGVDSVSGCSLRQDTLTLNNTDHSVQVWCLLICDDGLACPCRLEDAANCSLVFQTLLDVLRGANYPQYVASFGNSPLDYPLDWVPVKSNFNPGVSTVGKQSQVLKRL